MFWIAINSLFTARKIAFYALLISLIALGAAIYAIIRQKRKNKHAANRDVDRSPNHLAKNIQQIPGLQEYITTTVQKIVKNELTKASIDPNGKLVSKIADVVIYCIRLEENERIKNNIEQQSVQQIPLSNRSQQEQVAQNYYASALDERDNRTFYAVTLTPMKGETIFKFTEIQKGKCEFEVYEGAFNMVLKESDYLNGACDFEKSGNTRVVTVHKGVAEQNIDGKWQVKEQAKVRFE
ncbi:MAG: hypothetical protein NC038_00030 [Paludibacter sp.]|nr:hypothetical protein [Bacteroidales bacterium]MCM1068773.1 hypothetical protein [Prevotella sp.]MCM1354485.1 hypothetical protein [Bacteroides sp.]MCM1443288.1 hypothetical protein [Muribaculum sp.]MCM1481027.1 hypothetical protein [Paludibacter sp.]